MFLIEVCDSERQVKSNLNIFCLPFRSFLIEQQNIPFGSHSAIRLSVLKSDARSIKIARGYSHHFSEQPFNSVSSIKYPRFVPNLLSQHCSLFDFLRFSILDCQTLMEINWKGCYKFSLN